MRRMNPARIVGDYLLWHYSQAFADMTRLFINVLWFVVHFFSVPILLRTLFSPWKRIHDEYQLRGIEDILATFVANTISRLFGAVVRTCIIVLGLAVLVLVIMFSCLFLMFWILAPAVTIVTFVHGLALLF